jgi:hypothetical protein
VAAYLQLDDMKQQFMGSGQKPFRFVTAGSGRQQQQAAAQRYTGQQKKTANKANADSTACEPTAPLRVPLAHV